MNIFLWTQLQSTNKVTLFKSLTLSRVIMCQVSSCDLRSSRWGGERVGLRATNLQSVTISSHRLDAAFWAELELFPPALLRDTLLWAEEIFVTNHHTSSCDTSRDKLLKVDQIILQIVKLIHSFSKTRFTPKKCFLQRNWSTTNKLKIN